MFSDNRFENAAFIAAYIFATLVLIFTK